MRNLQSLFIQCIALMSLAATVAAQYYKSPIKLVSSTELDGVWKALAPSPVAGRWVFGKSFADKKTPSLSRYYLGIGQISVGETAITVTTVQSALKTPFDFQLPQWSPNGLYLMARGPLDFTSLGGGNRSLHIIDLQANLFWGFDGSVYPIIRWSPNSRYIAYLTGSDENGRPSRLIDHDYSSPALMVYDLNTRRATPV